MLNTWIEKWFWEAVTPKVVGSDSGDGRWFWLYMHIMFQNVKTKWKIYFYNLYTQGKKINENERERNKNNKVFVLTIRYEITFHKWEGDKVKQTKWRAKTHIEKQRQ